MSNYLIEASGISKKYKIGQTESYQTFRDSIVSLMQRPFNKHDSKKPQTKDFWALKNINFKISEGQVFGIVGPNGSGKSTLLKIISRITAPTNGKIVLRGRVGSLLEVGTGFHQELTGRENIYLNGAILGMTRKEIRRKFEEIVAFSGIEQFLDMPVKRYSSGMYVRLAFAVAAHLDPEILLIDEVLSVGDAEFQRKCINKMGGIAKSGRTIIYVSHNLSSVKALCHNGIYLQNGSAKYLGKIDKVIEKYSASASERRNLLRSFDGTLKDVIRIRRININGQYGSVVTVNPESKLHVVIEGLSKQKQPNFRLTLSIFKDDTRLFSIHDVKDYSQDLKAGKFVVTYTIGGNFLRPGRYTLAFGGHRKGGYDYFWGENLANLIVSNVWSEQNEEINVGVVNVPHYIAHRNS